MADERLVNYIRDNLSRGYSPDSLRQTLVNQGWNINQVDEAINIAQAPSPQPQTPSAPQAKPSRPTGVTIICVLGFLGAILVLFSGILLAGLGGLMGGLTSGDETVSMDLGGLGSLLGLFGYVFIIIGIVDFVGFYLLLKMKRIGWIIITVMGIIFIAMNVINFSVNNILGIVLWVIIIGYLFMKRKLFV